MLPPPPINVHEMRVALDGAYGEIFAEVEVSAATDKLERAMRARGWSENFAPDPDANAAAVRFARSQLSRLSE
jgi:hypothetical protein